jgi:hypothetical protein
MTSLYAVPIIDIAPFLAGDPVGTREILRHVTRALLASCGITPYYTDKAGVYRRHLRR